MANSKRKAHCGKKPFSTLLSAQMAARRTTTGAKKRGDPIITGLAAYKCPYCDCFHVGRSQVKGINWAIVEAKDKELHRLRAAAESGRGE